MGLFDDLFGSDKKKSQQAFGLFSFLNEMQEDDKKRKQQELEKEMENQGLEDWQKELVRNGEYEPTSFEEEDLEEDDYYYEDE